jgi:26S proteasome regulatory subunit N10
MLMRLQALRMSMEEEAARQAAAQVASNPAAPAASASAPAPAASEPAPAADDEDEQLLQQALALSEGHDVEMDDSAGAAEDLTEDEMIARAIEMSMQGDEEDDGKQKK